ncbi:MAG TPA: DNA polymerase IV, partial [Planctomycetes bacterium]|nr:DNA polymerase IV [Planctomycetota bacterium]
YTPLVEPLSLDEAFLDLSGTEGLFGPPLRVAREIKLRVRKERGLVASVGLASSKLVAKIASDMEKPDGLVYVPAGEEETFLAPLPVERMFGVGPATAKALKKAGIPTLGALARAPAALLRTLLGERGEELSRMARGEDPRPVVPSRLPKGHSRERTFPRDVESRAFLERCLLEFADQVAWDLRRMGLAGRVVRLKVRTRRFRTLTRSRTLPEPTDLPGPLYQAALELLEGLLPLPPVRLLGLGLGGLLPGGTPREGDLFQAPGRERERRLVRGIDAIRRKWGKGAILPGRLLQPGEGEEERGEDPE